MKRKFYILIQTSQMPFQNESIEQVSSKSDNAKMFKIMGQGRGENWDLEKNMQTSQIQSQNESMQKFTSKSDNSEVFKIRGKIYGWITRDKKPKSAKFETSQLFF